MVHHLLPERPFFNVSFISSDQYLESSDRTELPCIPQQFDSRELRHLLLDQHPCVEVSGSLILTSGSKNDPWISSLQCRSIFSVPSEESSNYLLMTVSILVSPLQRVSPKLFLPLGSALPLWRTFQHRSEFWSMMWFDHRIRMELKLQRYTFRVFCKLLCPRQVRIVHRFRSTLLHKFPFHLEVTCVPCIKIDSSLHSVTEEHGRIVQRRPNSNLLHSTIWITSGLLVVFFFFKSSLVILQKVSLSRFFGLHFCKTRLSKTFLFHLI